MYYFFFLHLFEFPLLLVFVVACLDSVCCSEKKERKERIERGKGKKMLFHHFFSPLYCYSLLSFFILSSKAAEWLQGLKREEKQALKNCSHLLLLLLFLKTCSPFIFGECTVGVKNELNPISFVVPR